MQSALYSHSDKKCHVSKAKSFILLYFCLHFIMFIGFLYSESAHLLGLCVVKRENSVKIWRRASEGVQIRSFKTQPHKIIELPFMTIKVNSDPKGLNQSDSLTM